MKKFTISNSMRGLEITAILISGYLIITDNHPRGSYLLTYGLFFIFLINFLFETYCVEILGNETVLFKRLFFTKSYNVQDIVRITKGFKFESVILRNGKITLSPFLSNLPALKSNLKQLNPDIEIVDNTEKPESVRKTIFLIVSGLIVFGALLAVQFLLPFNG